jgi:oxygen-independent coproporphyrinogen-3 oxidase
VLGELLHRLGTDRRLAGDAEVTLEANPDDVTGDRATRWIAAGITRFSLGAQSFSPEALAWMHRTHTADQIARAGELLRDAGAESLSLDLIYGLPDSIARDWSADLDRAMALSPDHISLYGLTVEPHTPLAHWMARGEAIPTPDQRAAEEYLLAHQRLSGAGYQHYEVSNAARPGHRSRHNLAYWNRRSYIGLGPSAHSGLGNLRSWNVREWEGYRRRTAARESVVAGSETLTPEQVELESLYLGLRTDLGVPASRVAPRLATQWQEAGWAWTDRARIQLTAEGWLRLDALVASLTRC